MTAIKGYIGPNRRPGELGVHSVDRFHFFVPNLAVAQSFYGEFGLEVRERDGLLSLNTHGHDGPGDGKCFINCPNHCALHERSQ